MIDGLILNDFKNIYLDKLLKDELILSDNIFLFSILSKLLKEILTLSDSKKSNINKTFRDVLILLSDLKSDLITLNQDYLEISDKIYFRRIFTIKILKELIKLTDNLQISIPTDLMLFAENVVPTMLIATEKYCEECK